MSEISENNFSSKGWGPAIAKMVNPDPNRFDNIKAMRPFGMRAIETDYREQVNYDYNMDRL